MRRLAYGALLLGAILVSFLLPERDLLRADRTRTPATTDLPAKPSAAREETSRLTVRGVPAGTTVLVTRASAMPGRAINVHGRETAAYSINEEIDRPRIATGVADQGGSVSCIVPRGAVLSIVAGHRTLMRVADAPEIEAEFPDVAAWEDEPEDVAAAHVVTVQDSERRPIVGAFVLLYHGSFLEPPAARQESDDQGRVALSASPRNRLLIGAAGHASVLVRDFEGDFTVQLNPGRSIVGRVVDSGGQPIAGVTIRTRHDRDRGSRLLEGAWPWWRRVTAADGAFRFDGLRDGKYQISVRAPGYTSMGTTIWPTEPSAEFVLQRTARVDGVIEFEDGTPAPKASVRTTPNTTTRADEQGRFQLRDVTPGQRVIRGWTDDHRAAGVTVELAEKERRTGVRLVLRPRTRSYVRYQAYDHDGTPVRDVRTITLSKPAGTKGRYRIQGRSISNKPGPVSTWLEATSSADPQVEPIRVDLPRPVAVVFEMQGEDGAPISKLTRVQANGDCWVESVVESRITVRSHPDVPVRLHVCADGFAAKSFPPVGVEGEPHTLTMRRATSTLAGRLLDHEGAPVRAWVRADGNGSASVRTDEQGAFVLTGLAPGSVTLAADTLRREFELRAGANHVGDLRLPKPIRIQGRVVDQAGKPVWQATVRLFDPKTGRNDSRDPLMRTRGDGSFAVSTSSPHLFLRVDKPGFASAIMPVSSRPRIELRRGGRIVVSISEADAKQSWVPGLRSPDGAFTWVPRKTSHDDRREWRLEGVPAGDWEIVPVSYRRPAASKRVLRCTVVACETVAVSFR
ncbi:MAG: carboxypeptidase-like regulatory domain-containing protein [Planctomycetota bacterium]